MALRANVSCECIFYIYFSTRSMPTCVFFYLWAQVPHKTTYSTHSRMYILATTSELGTMWFTNKRSIYFARTALWTHGNLFYLQHVLPATWVNFFLCASGISFRAQAHSWKYILKLAPAARNFWQWNAGTGATYKRATRFSCYVHKFAFYFLFQLWNTIFSKEKNQYFEHIGIKFWQQNKTISLN